LCKKEECRQSIQHERTRPSASNTRESRDCTSSGRRFVSDGARRGRSILLCRARPRILPFLRRLNRHSDFWLHYTPARHSTHNLGLCLAVRASLPGACTSRGLESTAPSLGTWMDDSNFLCHCDVLGSNSMERCRLPSASYHSCNYGRAFSTCFEKRHCHTRNLCYGRQLKNPLDIASSGWAPHAACPMQVTTLHPPATPQPRSPASGLAEKKFSIRGVTPFLRISSSQSGWMRGSWSSYSIWATVKGKARPCRRGFPDGYASATTPLQNWFLPPTSTSYLRTKSSLPSVPIR
jgi:hypothetical protein